MCCAIIPNFFAWLLMNRKKSCWHLVQVEICLQRFPRTTSMVVENTYYIADIALVAIFLPGIVFLLFWVFRGGESGDEENMLSEEERAKRRRLALMRFGGDGEKKLTADAESTGEKPKSMSEPQVGTPQSIVDAGERHRGALLRFRGSNNYATPAVDCGHSPRSISNESPATTNKKRAKLEDSTAKKIKAGDETAAGNDTDIKTKPRNQRTPPPPAQLICEALSIVCGTEVTVKPGKGPWGGEGWVKRKKSSARLSPTNSARKLPKLTLPMLEQRRSGDSEWAQLEAALESILEASSTAANPFSILICGIFRKGGISTAASWHCKTHGAAARDIVNDIVDGKTEESLATKKGLMRCLSVLKCYLAKTVAIWLDKDISTVSSQEDDDSDEEDLFTDDYNSESSKAERVARLLAALTNTALGEILELCSRPNATLVITKQLLSDIVVHSSDGPRLAEGLLRRSLDRLPSPGSTKDFDFVLFAKDSAAVTHLVANSQDVAMALSQLLKTEVGSVPSTGNEFEQSSVLRSLLSLGGYTLPSAGFELRQSSSSNQFRLYESLKTVESFPLSYFAYGKKLDPLITKVIDEASAIMGHARTFGSKIMRQIILKKGGNGKDIFFSWLGR